MSKSKIEWTGRTWNMIGGCTKVAEGCRNCYALRDSWRIMHNPKRPKRYEGVATKLSDKHPCNTGLESLRWAGEINLDWDAIGAPFGWKHGLVFVCSMSDLFHEKVPLVFLDKVFDTMNKCPELTFQVLTKRAKRMKEYLIEADGDHGYVERWYPNVQFGVSASTQKELNDNMAHLGETPGKVKFVSVEPMLEPIRFPSYRAFIYPDGFENNGPMITTLGYSHEPDASVNWVIIGCESGPHRRPMKLEWAIDLVSQCKAAGVPVFVKQLSINNKVSKNPEEWPEELRVREYPHSKSAR